MGSAEAPPTAGKIISDLVRDVALSAADDDDGRATNPFERGRNGIGRETSSVLHLLTRVKEAREEAERMEKHYLGRKDKIIAELHRLAQRRTAKEKEGKTEEQTRRMVKTFENIEARSERLDILKAGSGDRLIRLERRRDFAKESKVLLAHFSSFTAKGGESRGETSLDKLDDFQAASMAIKLRSLGEKLLVGTSELDVASPPSSPNPSVRKRSDLAGIVERIQVYCDNLENRLILGFDKSLRHKNYGKMRECARSLLLFQGGGRLISHYLASRPVFLETTPKSLDEEVAAVLDAQGHGDSGDHGGKATKQLMDLLGRWYKHSLESVKKERIIINEVFPNAEETENKLVQRLFDQNIQAYLTAILEETREKIGGTRHTNPREVQTFLRIFAASYEKTRELAAGLQTIGCTGIDIDARTSDLFCEHLGDYPKIEFDLLEALFSAKKSQTKEKRLSHEIIEHYFVCAKESISRCALLCLDQDKSDAIQKVFSSNSSRYASPFGLLDQVYQYLIGCLQSAMDLADKSSGALSLFSLSSESQASLIAERILGASLVEIFDTVSAISSCIGRLQVSVRKEIIDPMGEGREGPGQRCDRAFGNFIALLENSVAQALSFGISNCVQVLAKVVKSKQKRQDFCPQDDDMAMGSMGKVTPACDVIVDCVRSVHALCVSKLGAANIGPFMTEIGEGIYQALKQHVSCFAYNPQGALRLKRDLAEYSDVLKSVGAPSVSSAFTDLGDQANLLVVMPESIPDLIKEDLKISKATVLFWIKLREDYKSANISGLVGF